MSAQRLELGGVRQHVVLATLLLGVNRVVTMGRLQEAVYGEDLPSSAHAQVQISISSLRRLFASHGHPAIIGTQAQGYVIQVGPGQLDSRRFEELVAAARASRDAGLLDQAVASYRDALRLWRGPALDGLDSHLLQVAASRLDEQHIAANEDRLTLELDLGRHHELVGELTELVEEFPLRERLRGQLMLALYRCDRTAEALQVYRLGRRVMIEELGIDPGERLQRLEHAILTADSALDPPASPISLQPGKQQVPCLLPTAIADFIDRSEQVEQIRRCLTGGAESDLAVPVVVIAGRGGVGKSSIAIHAAHGLAERFPHGQLFADLHGGSAHPVAPAQVLERFLRVLGVPGGQVPDGLDERAEMYRGLVADRKVLVVLDDAARESQVSPLLPGRSAAAVIITSRSRLSGLAGASHVRVNVFDAGTSLDMLARIVGRARVHREAPVAVAVAGHCGHLPLALRIAGARLSERPHWSIRQLAERLADETRRLDELRHDDMGVRPSIALTYESASEQARRLFRRLALLDQPVFSGWVGAALLDQPPGYAEDLLDELVSAHLVETPGSGSGPDSQYRFHELIRVFARERLTAEEPAAERKAALERALAALFYLAEQAHRRYHGGDYGRIPGAAPRWPLPEGLVEQLVADPLSWYERERAALVSAVRQAARDGLTELCWSLALIAVPLFESRVYLDDWRDTSETALAAAREAHHVRGQAAMLYSLGELHIVQQRFVPARRELTAAAQLFEDAGDDHGLALVTNHIASVDRLSGPLGDAAKRYEQALAIFRRTADRGGIIRVLRNMAQLKLDLGEFDAANELLAEAWRQCQAARNARVEAQVLHQMGRAHLLSGEPASAMELFERVLVITSDLGDSIGEAYALQGLGVAMVRQGKFGQARSALQRAEELASATGDRFIGTSAALGLGELALASGDPAQALVFGQQAAAAFRDMRAPLHEAHALALIGDAHAALGDGDAAQAASARATTLRTQTVGDARSS